MADIYIDPLTHDISLVNNRMVLVSTEEESTRQRLVITLKTFKGEWDFNINYGVPYLKNENNPVQLLGKSNKDLLDLEIKQAILNTDGVVSLNTFTSVFDKAQRTVELDFTAVTENGELISVTTTI
jgi:hypothetical protein